LIETRREGSGEGRKGGVRNFDPNYYPRIERKGGEREEDGHVILIPLLPGATKK